MMGDGGASVVGGTPPVEVGAGELAPGVGVWVVTVVGGGASVGMVGVGVGSARGVSPGGVGVCEPTGAPLGREVPVPEGRGVWLCEGSSVGVGVPVPLGSGLPHGSGLGSALGSGVPVSVGVPVRVGVGVGVSVKVAVGVNVGSSSTDMLIIIPPPMGGKVIAMLSLGEVPFAESTDTTLVLTQELVSTTSAMPSQTAAPDSGRSPSAIGSVETQEKQDPRVSSKVTS
jgi:hypothetical protein